MGAPPTARPLGGAFSPENEDGDRDADDGGDRAQEAEAGRPAVFLEYEVQ